MNAILTPRALDVIADSGETGEPIFRTPCSVGSGEVPVTVSHHLAHAHKLLSRMEDPNAQEVRHTLYSIAETLRCETCDGSGRVVETIAVDVPGHNRAGSYDVTVTCDDCAGEGRTAIAAATEGAES